MSQLTTISGYVPLRKKSELDSDRYDFITLDQTEPNAGLPDSEGALFISGVDGTRSFTTEPRLTQLSFKSNSLEQINPATSPTYFLVFKEEPGSQAGIGLDDSVAWSIGEFEEVDTLQTVTDRGNVTTQSITIANLSADSAVFSGGVRIDGNLWVNGTETIINSTSLTVDDKNIVIGEGAPDAITVDGGGITLDGANATITYQASSDRWRLNKNLELEGTDKKIFFGNNNLTFVGENGVSDKLILSGGGTGSPTDTVTIDAAGQVGIGTDTPSVALEVQGLTALDSTTVDGLLELKEVLPKDPTAKILFRRQSDGVILEGETTVANVDQISTSDTDSDATHYLMFTYANNGTGGFDSALIDTTTLTYNPSSNIFTTESIVATGNATVEGLTNLDSTKVAGDIQIQTTSGRLLDSEGRSFVIYDSAGVLLWGNNGISAGNLGGPSAVARLIDLTDVAISEPITSGYVVKWDEFAAGGSGAWVAGPDNTGVGGAGIALTDLDAVTEVASGDGNLSYSNVSGVFTYTPPELSLLNLTDVAGDGTNGQVLQTDGAGNFSFVNQTGGGGSSITTSDEGSSLTTGTTSFNFVGTGVTATNSGNDVTVTIPGVTGALSTRSTIIGTTGTISNNNSADLDITGGAPAYALLKIQSNDASWVRLYTDTASRTADASRVITDDPAPDAGVVAEIITTGNQVIKMSPGVIGWLDTGTTVHARVTNLSGGARAITVTLTLLALEA
jgi:hypothetical protein